jgi:hypothetical protein
MTEQFKRQMDMLEGLAELRGTLDVEPNFDDELAQNLTPLEREQYVQSLYKNQVAIQNIDKLIDIIAEMPTGGGDAS